MAERREPVGAPSASVMTVRRSDVEAFAATLGEAPVRTSTGGDGQVRTVVPLGFCARVAADAVVDCVNEALCGAGLQGIVQVAHHCELDRLLELGDRVETAARVTGRHRGPGGTLLDVSADLCCAGERVARAQLTLLVLGSRLDGSSTREPARRRRSAASVLRDPILCETIALTARHAADYADAAGDPNPVHAHPAAARAAGYPDVIVPGLCLLWLATAGVVRRFGDDDPDQVAEVSARFTSAATPGERLRLLAAPIDDRVIGFRLDGTRRAVVKAGRVRMRSAVRRT